MERRELILSLARDLVVGKAANQVIGDEEVAKAIATSFKIVAKAVEEAHDAINGYDPERR